MLPQSTIERIEKEARSERQKYVKEELQIGTPANSAKWTGLGFKDGYITGATAEASRSQLLVEALEKIRKLAGAPIIYAIATEALKKHHNEVH
jgi:hypothetical protein